MRYSKTRRFRSTGCFTYRRNRVSVCASTKLNSPNAAFRWHADCVIHLGRCVMKIERIDHLNITVADIDRSINWYERVLGMKSERMGEGRAALLFGQQKIHLDLAGATAMSGEKRQPAHICFVTDTPIGEVAAQVERCGVLI